MRIASREVKERPRWLASWQRARFGQFVPGKMLELAARLIQALFYEGQFEVLHYE
jgi:hypothetical protein